MYDPKPIKGDCVWEGPAMAASRRWVKKIPAELLALIDHNARDTDTPPWQHITRDNFPLPGGDAFFDDVREELENGSGLVKLKGLDVTRYSEAQLRSIWFGLGRHIGTLMYQNRRGEMMRDIQDAGGKGVSLYGETTDATGKPFLSSGARTLSPGQLRFHTDRCDIVGLLCVRQASAGGVSTIASSATVYNAILAEHPDLHRLLCSPIPRSRFGEEAGGEYITYDLPVFGVRDGKLTSHFSMTYIENAQLRPGTRRLTAAEHDAIQLLLDTAAQHCFEMTLEPGDIQLLNNHVVYHGRTAFRDDASTGHDRMLMRLWLSAPNSRALPEDHAVLWGDVRGGAARGGIAQPAAIPELHPAAAPAPV